MHEAQVRQVPLLVGEQKPNERAAYCKAGGGTPKIGVVCGLRPFDLALIAPASFRELNFEEIEFRVDSAAKMDVGVLFNDFKFVGPLSFVETLRDLIPLDGFSDPPYLDISPQASMSVSTWRCLARPLG